eukprot:COSAG01_NODE_49208_length_374_cov_0.752727_1_plen_40_part_01
MDTETVSNQATVTSRADAERAVPAPVVSTTAAAGTGVAGT